MQKSLFAFIWQHSKRDQLVLLFITVATFPVLFLSLELPKRIINDAIGGDGSEVVILGLTLTQLQFLMVLCCGFLLSVLVNGLIKMRINTMKGVLAERLLRRFRFELLSRVMRFPRPYFRRTSQGELVSMITSEAEPMGGLMGDFVAHPVFQAGQMLTILTFLFLQSLWFGLAAIALIPLQAWLIPKLQRQINLLNKARVQQVRKLAGEIGETAAGVSDIRINGGLRYRTSLFSDRLGQLFSIRFEIYQKKFFMKFLNNFINQLTPFFFYSVGGYLAIQGEITVGALVAALAAYKDISGPWKELLTYYNQTQDMALRWQIVTEKFAPETLVPDALVEGEADAAERLIGDIVLDDVTVEDEDGNVVLEDLSLTIPAGARVAIKTRSEAAALAIADVLTREVIPTRGAVTIAGKPLNSLHQSTVAKRIGYAHSKPHIFEGTLGDNLMLPFKQGPHQQDSLSQDIARWREEADKSGNSIDPFDVDWIHPDVAGLSSRDEINEWWFQLVTAMGIDDFMVRRALRSCHDRDAQPELAEAIVRLRPEIARRLSEAGLDDVVFRFDPDSYNPVSPLGVNLLYALPVRPLTQRSLSQETAFINMLAREGIEEDVAKISIGVIQSLTMTFGTDGTDHPLFRRLNMEPELYEQLAGIVSKRRQHGDEALSKEERGLMLTVPFAFSAEQVGPGFPESFKQRVVEIRKANGEQLVEELGGLMEPIEEDRYISIMTLLGNAIFGRISSMAGAREKQIEDIVVEVIAENNLRRIVAQSVFDLSTTQGGQNLPTVFRERIAFSRAGIKKPDMLVLGNALASHTAEERAVMRERISVLLPEATKIFIESHFNAPETYDLFIEIKDGRIDGVQREEDAEDESLKQDLTRKMKVIGETDLFGDLAIQQQRLLAYSARWYKVEAGQDIYQVGDIADAAYLCVKGLAGLYWPNDESKDILVTEVPPGRLIGDLAVIMREERPMRLTAIEDTVFLRLGAKELMAVIENDNTVAVSLLRTVSGHLRGAGNGIRALREFAIEQGVDFAAFDQKLQRGLDQGHEQT